MQRRSDWVRHADSPPFTFHFSPLTCSLTALANIGYMDTMLEMRPVSSTSAAIAEQLRDRIVTGELAPDTPLRQENLARELGVSRLPIRDALNKLATEGLVEILPNRGAYVSTLTPEQCAEIYDLRVLLESDALVHAIPHHTERSLRALKAIQAELELEDETVRWVAGDRRFHEALYEPSQRLRTLDMIKALRNSVDRFYLANLKHTVRRQKWKMEHRRLLQAVTAGDIELSRQLLVAHLRATQTVVLTVLGQKPN
jgi:DNA-binding GntR family transcriptional regulator